MCQNYAAARCYNGRMSAFDLGIVFTAKDLASNHVNNLKKNFMELDDSIQQSQKNFAKHAAAFTAGIGMMAVGAKIASVPLSFISVAADFEKSLVAMRAATGYTIDDMKRMEEAAIRLGVETQFSPDQAVMAMKQIGSSGYDAANTLKIVGNAVAFAGASMGQIDMETAASTMVAALQSFSLASEESKHVADALTRTTQISNLTFQDFDRVIAGAGSSAAATHQDLETMLASVGLMKLQGGTALQATEKFRMALDGLKKPAAESGFKMLNMQVTDLMKDGKFIELPDMLAKIQKGLQNVKGADASDTFIKQQEALGKIFGIEGIQMFNKLMKSSFTDAEGNVKKGTDAMRAAISELRKDQDTAAEANKAYLETFAGLSDLLSGIAQTIKIVLGKALISDASKALQFLINNFMQPFLNLLMETPALAGLVSKGILGIGVALMTVGAGIATFAGFAMIKAAMITAGITASGVFAGIGSAISAAFLPLTLTVATVAAVVMAWRTNFGGFRDFTTKFFTDLWNSAKGFFEGFAKGFDMAGFIKDMQPYVETAKMVFTDLADAIGEVVKSLGFVKGASDLEGATESGKALGEVMRGIIQPAAQIVSAAIIGAVDAVTWLVDAFNWLGRTGQNVFLTVLAIAMPWVGVPLLIARNWDMVSGALRWVLDAAKAVGNAFLDFAFNVPVWIAAAASKAEIAWVQFKTAVSGIVDSLYNYFVTQFNQIKTFVGGVVSGIVSFFMGLPGTLGAIASGAASAVYNGLASMVSMAGGVVSSVVSFFLGLPQQLATIGMNAASGLINALAQGIQNQAAKIVNSVRDMVQKARNLLPGSDAKEGPLSDLTHSGSMLPRTFALGMEQTANEPRTLMERTVQLDPRPESTQMASTPTLLPAEGASRIESLLESMVAMLAGGQGQGSGQGAPRVIQLVLDRQVLAEVNLEAEDDFYRRSYAV